MDTFTAFLNNAALMLILCVIYDTFNINSIPNKKNLRDTLTGVLVGLICIAVMLNPWSLEKGLYFDTRWVLLSLCGLYFGLIPTMFAVVIAGAFRLYQGGPGGIVGTVVIVVTACVGLVWKYWHDKGNKPLSWLQLYLFGIVVQLAMLSCIFLFPADLRNTILKTTALPILLIYPVLTTIIGLILKEQADRRRADKERLYSISLATAALESTPEGILIINREGKISRWNQKFVELWNVPQHLLDTTLKNPVLAYASSQMADPEKFLAKATELHEHPDKSCADTLNLTDGRIFSLYSQPQKIGAEIVGRFWSFQDITEHKRAEEILRSSESKFRSIVETSQDWIWEMDLSGKHTFSNARASDILGYSLTDILSIDLLELVHQEDREEIIARLPQLIAKKSGWHGWVLRWRHKDGSCRVLESTANPVLNESGELVGFRGVDRDITEGKKAEKTLQESKDLLAEIIELSPISMAIVSMDGTIEQINRRAIETFGYSHDDIPSMERWWIQAYPDESYRAEVFAQWMGLIGKAIAEKSEIERREYRVSCKDGTVRMALIYGILVADKVFVIFDDITDRKLAEADRLALERHQLQAQKLESLGVLAGGIAHDFNNILTAIMGNISYAKMDLDESQPASEPLARAEKAVKRAARLANQLLVFAKGGDPVKKSISVHSIVHDTVSLTLSGTNIQAVIDLPADLYAVNADEGQISQAFHNIIINAVQAMPDGGSFTISANNVAINENNNLNLSAGDYVQISFTDEGLGIAAEQVGRIFDPYFTTKADGSGLGLASTYAIIKKHFGNISVSSSPGKGTTFKILIPACGEPVTEDLKEAHVPENAQRDYSILVMDDDEMVRELAEITLKRLNYTVVCCNNGSEAVSLYRSARERGMPFSFVIMDLTIQGGMGGVEAAKQILAFDPEAQLIVSSGYSADPVMANFSDYGFCASLEKPYDVEEISRILQRTQRSPAIKSASTKK